MKRLIVPIVLVLTVLLAGCRVPNDSAPRDIPANQVPFDLLAPSTTAPPVTSQVPTVDGTVYLLNQNHLVAVKRSVPAPLSLGSILAALVQGPTSQESALGYVSSVGPQSGVASAQVVNGSAMIGLSSSFAGTGVQEQIKALAQIVYTVTEVQGVQNVHIELNSQTANVPRGDGSATTDPLTRGDYSSFAPLSG